MLVTVAAIQTQIDNSVAENVSRACELVHSAQGQGAQIILLPELFQGKYFPQSQKEEHFALAMPAANNPMIEKFQQLAKRLQVVLPLSFFERDDNEYYNSVAVIDADGAVLGIYRKSHIPDGPGYQEKFYFRPGNTGFRAWKTRYGTIGVGICWDQWFPEAARAMVLAGADLLLYPTAIGSEPEAPELCTKDPWQRAMIGHAVSNVVGVVAANRVGQEEKVDFYGHSFIADHRGDLLGQLNDQEQGVVCGQFDLDYLQKHRASYGFFRDRRTGLYDPLIK